jgi:hypothetical protein
MEPDLNADDLPDAHERMRDALLAYGGGDPVVVMPDGTLRRLLIGAPSPPGVTDFFGNPFAPSIVLADPVVPE